MATQEDVEELSSPKPDDAVAHVELDPEVAPSVAQGRAPAQPLGAVPDTPTTADDTGNDAAPTTMGDASHSSHHQGTRRWCTGRGQERVGRCLLRRAAHYRSWVVEDAGRFVELATAKPDEATEEASQSSARKEALEPEVVPERADPIKEAKRKATASRATVHVKLSDDELSDDDAGATLRGGGPRRGHEKWRATFRAFAPGGDPGPDVIHDGRPKVLSPRARRDVAQAPRAQGGDGDAAGRCSEVRVLWVEPLPDPHAQARHP